MDSKQKDEQINRAMAGVAGWQGIGIRYGGKLTGFIEGVHQRNAGYHEIPNYLTDLNAVHEVEKTLRGTGEQYYNDPIIQRRWKEYQYYVLETYGVCATARQRCTAILKTLNKWNPEWN